MGDDDANAMACAIVHALLDSTIQWSCGYGAIGRCNSERRTWSDEGVGAPRLVVWALGSLVLALVAAMEC